METFSDMPIKFFWFYRAVPQTPMETEDELFPIKNIKRLLKNPNVQALGINYKVAGCGYLKSKDHEPDEIHKKSEKESGWTYSGHQA
ncbi:MAG: hypothetical protein JXA35_02150 [Deltaproteobacteria bacterium]|nr:hypothetical protein [Deltaproteobacteria bacterium]